MRNDGARFTPAFRALWAGSAVSNVGDGMRIVALPLLAVTLTDSAFLVTLATAAQFLPWLVVGPFAGAFIDRTDRRALILRVQPVRALIMAALAVAVLADAAALWQIYLVAFTITAGEILVDPALIATVPNVVDDDELEAANGRIMATHTVGDELIGAPLGGLLFAVAPWLPFAIDGTTYALSAERFRHLPGGAPERTDGRSLREDMREGFEFLINHLVLRRVQGAVALLVFGGIGVVGLLVLLITDVLEGSEFAYGVLFAVGAVGAAAGSLLAPRLADRSPAHVFTMCAATQGAAVIAMAFSRSLIVAIALWAVAAVPAGIIMPLGLSIQQRLTPNELLGRVNVTGRIFTRGSVVIGALLFGAVAEATSVRTAIALAGVAIAAAAPLFGRALRPLSSTDAARNLSAG